MRFQIGGSPRPGEHLFVHRGVEKELEIAQALTRGVSVVVFGPSRAGKTTLAHLLDDQFDHAVLLTATKNPGNNALADWRDEVEALRRQAGDAPFAVLVDEVNQLLNRPEWLHQLATWWKDRVPLALFSNWPVELADELPAELRGWRTYALTRAIPLDATETRRRLADDLAQTLPDERAAAFPPGKEPPDALPLDRAEELASRIVDDCDGQLFLIQLLGNAIARGQLKQYDENGPSDAVRAFLRHALHEALRRTLESQLDTLDPRERLEALCYAARAGRTGRSTDDEQTLSVHGREWDVLFALGFANADGKPSGPSTWWAWDLQWCREQLPALEKSLPYARRLFEWNATGALPSPEDRSDDLLDLPRERLTLTEQRYREALEEARYAEEVSRRQRLGLRLSVVALVLSAVMFAAVGFWLHARADAEAARADVEKARADAEKARADAEKAARDLAAEEARALAEHAAATGERLARETAEANERAASAAKESARANAQAEQAEHEARRALESAAEAERHQQQADARRTVALANQARAEADATAARAAAAQARENAERERLRRVTDLTTALAELDAAVQERERADQALIQANQERDSAVQARDAAVQARDAAVQARDAAVQARDAAVQARLAAEGDRDCLRLQLQGGPPC